MHCNKPNITYLLINIFPLYVFNNFSLYVLVFLYIQTGHIYIYINIIFDGDSDTSDAVWEINTVIDSLVPRHLGHNLVIIRSCCLRY